MTLTAADVERLRQRGAGGFLVSQDDGVVRLRNVGGRCVFLCHGVCSVYGDRLEGCRLYPLVLDVRADRAVRDAFCLYRHEFRFPYGAVRRLRLSVTTEEREAEERAKR